MDLTNIAGIFIMLRQLALLTALAMCWLPAVAEQQNGVSRWLEIHEVARAVTKAPGDRQKDMALCWLSAYSRDRSATNLRAGPDPFSRVIAKLPAERAEAGTKIGPEFQVIAGKGDRFLITGAHWAGYDLPERLLGVGPAWMASNLMGFSIESQNLREAPRENAKVILKMVPREGEPDTWGPDSAKVDRIFACSGSFIDIAVTLPDGRKARGWASGLCSNQVTTCGGGHVSAEERSGGLFYSEANCPVGTDDKNCPSASLRP